MKKALIVRLSSLGDVIFNIPLAHVLHNNGYEVSWIVSEKGYDVIKDNPVVKNVYLVPRLKWKKHPFSPKNFIEYVSILLKIRKEHFDVAIDTQLMFKSLIWMLFCNAKRKLCFKQGKEFSTFGGNEIIDFPERNSCHAVLEHLQYAKYLGLKGTDEIQFTVPPAASETKAHVDKLLENTDKTKPLVIIAPATTWRLKHWDKDNWKALIEAIKDDCSLVFTGTDFDRELISYIGGDKFTNLAGQTNIKDLMELFSRSSLVIAPDSGSAHLARAVGIPAVISIFCCTSRLKFGPFGDEKYFAVDGGLNCQPRICGKCSMSGIDFEKCIKVPAPEQIISIVNKVLKKSIT